MARKLSIKRDDSVLEIGCGCGAFLYVLRPFTDHLSGIDYSSTLLNFALRAIPNGQFKTLEARDVAKLNKKFQVIISNSVFQYFQTYDYSNLVLEKVHHILEPYGQIAILDINDLKKKPFFKDIRANGYGKDYKHLDQNFYSKTYFTKFAYKYGYEIEIEDQKIENYVNSYLRFNVFLTKKS